jgi:hypothetical protein
MRHSKWLTIWPTCHRNLLLGGAVIFCLALLLETSLAGRPRRGSCSELPATNGGAAARSIPGYPTTTELLAPWRVVERGMFADHGSVLVRDGAIHLLEGSPATGIVHTLPVPQSKYEIYLEAKRTGGSDFFCGLTFPIGQEYCSLIVGGWGGTAVGLSNIDSQSAIENESTRFIPFENDRWYRIRLRVSYARIEVWIDGTQVIDVETKDHKFDIWWEQDPMRPLGIATWNTTAAIRNFEIRKQGVADSP